MMDTNLVNLSMHSLMESAFSGKLKNLDKFAEFFIFVLCNWNDKYSFCIHIPDLIYSLCQYGSVELIDQLFQFAFLSEYQYYQAFYFARVNNRFDVLNYLISKMEENVVNYRIYAIEILNAMYKEQKSENKEKYLKLFSKIYEICKSHSKSLLLSAIELHLSQVVSLIFEKSDKDTRNSLYSPSCPIIDSCINSESYDILQIAVHYFPHDKTNYAVKIIKSFISRECNYCPGISDFVLSLCKRDDIHLGAIVHEISDIEEDFDTKEIGQKIIKLIDSYEKT